MTSPAPEVVTHDDVVVQRADGREDLARAADLLDRAESATGTPLVDEAERDRLARALDGPHLADEGWHPALASRAGQLVGYVAVVVARDGEAIGDAAVEADGDGLVVLEALLAGAVELAERAGAATLQVWTRRAGEPEVEAAHAQGFEVARRLAVLGRGLGAALPPAPTSSATVRTYRPGTDDEAVVEVLAAAYAGTEEAGWDLDRFRARTRLPWFRAGDLLVAELAPAEPDPGDYEPMLAGLHWLKRRDERTGEVYNLAVHPDAQGRGVGPLLLHAGLAHLREQGCDDVILWVDLANEPAVRLYAAQGFATRWEDLALYRTLRGSAPRR